MFSNYTISNSKFLIIFFQSFFLKIKINFETILKKKLKYFLYIYGQFSKIDFFEFSSQKYNGKGKVTK